MAAGPNRPNDLPANSGNVVLPGRVPPQPLEARNATDTDGLNPGVGGLVAALDTDVTLAANSDTRVASQKATKAYADTKLAATLDTDVTLAANSDTRVASQKATKAYADTKGFTNTGATATLGALVNLTGASGAFQDIFTLALPSAGTYFVFCNARYSCSIAVGAGFLIGKLTQDNGTQITDLVLLVFQPIVGAAAQGTAYICGFVTIGAADVLHLFVARDNNPNTTGSIQSDANGNTTLGYIKLA